MITEFFVFIKSKAVTHIFYKTEPRTTDTSHTSQAGKERRHRYAENRYWKPASLIHRWGNLASGLSAH